MQLPGYSLITCDASMPSVQLEPIAFRRAREANYNIENPQFPLDDPTSWTDGLASLSGERVTPCRILAVPAAYQAITRISGDISRCPLEPWQEIDGVWKCLFDDPRYRLTAIQPNREMDAFTFWQRVIVHRLVYQNAYVFVAFDLWVSRRSCCRSYRPYRAQAIRRRAVFETEVDGLKRELPANRVLHLQGIGFDNLKTYELVKAMRDAWGLALRRMNFAARVFRSGGRRGGVPRNPALDNQDRRRSARRRFPARIRGSGRRVLDRDPPRQRQVSRSADDAPR